MGFNLPFKGLKPKQLVYIPPGLTLKIFSFFQQCTPVRFLQPNSCYFPTENHSLVSLPHASKLWPQNKNQIFLYTVINFGLQRVLNTQQ